MSLLFNFAPPSRARRVAVRYRSQNNLTILILLTMAIPIMEQAQCEAGFCHATLYGMPLAECKAAASYKAMGRYRGPFRGRGS